MAKYMIHAVQQRMWYVEKFLIPSMLEQGIKQEDIKIHNDNTKRGNLRACMDAFREVDEEGGTWHLQDDVCICRDFRILTESLDFGLVAGFSSSLYDGAGNIGAVDRTKMWFSFPCIRIPNEYARGCGEWVPKYIIGNPVYRKYWEKGVNDDWAFRTYLQEHYPDVKAINLAPNLVDHIDYLLGGGTGGVRKKPCRAQYWKDNDLVEALEVRIKCLG